VSFEVYPTDINTAIARSFGITITLTGTPPPTSNVLFTLEQDLQDVFIITSSSDPNTISFRGGSTQVTLAALKSFNGFLRFRRANSLDPLYDGLQLPQIAVKIQELGAIRIFRDKDDEPENTIFLEASEAAVLRLRPDREVQSDCVVVMTVDSGLIVKNYPNNIIVFQPGNNVELHVQTLFPIAGDFASMSIRFTAVLSTDPAFNGFQMAPVTFQLVKPSEKLNVPLKVMGGAFGFGLALSLVVWIIMGIMQHCRLIEHVFWPSDLMEFIVVKRNEQSGRVLPTGLAAASVVTLLAIIQGFTALVFRLEYFTSQTVLVMAFYLSFTNSVFNNFIAGIKDNTPVRYIWLVVSVIGINMSFFGIIAESILILVGFYHQPGDRFPLAWVLTISILTAIGAMASAVGDFVRLYHRQDGTVPTDTYRQIAANFNG